MILEVKVVKYVNLNMFYILSSIIFNVLDFSVVVCIIIFCLFEMDVYLWGWKCFWVNVLLVDYVKLFDV